MFSGLRDSTYCLSINVFVIRRHVDFHKLICIPTLPYGHILSLGSGEGGRRLPAEDCRAPLKSRHFTYFLREDGLVQPVVQNPPP